MRGGSLGKSDLSSIISLVTWLEGSRCMLSVVGIVGEAETMIEVLWIEGGCKAGFGCCGSVVVIFCSKD
jgi:hypothetical protein